MSTGDRPDAVIFLHGFNETYNLNDAFYRDEVSLVVDSAGGKNLRTAYDLLLKNYQMSPFDLNTWPFVRWFFSDRNFLSGLHGSKPKTLQDIDEFKKVSFGNWFGSFDEQDALMARRLDSFSAQVADVHSTNLNLVAALLNSLKIPFGIALQPSYAFEANKNRVGELQIDNIRGAKRLPFYLGTRFYYHRLYQRLIENGITAGVPIFSIANERLYSDMTDPCFIDYVHLTPDCNHQIALILNSFLEKTLVNGNPILDVGLGATPAVPEWYYEFALRRP